LKDTASIKIYEELYSLKSEIDKKSEEFGLLLGKYSLPFLSMKFEMDKGVLAERNLKALDIWNGHLRKLGDGIFNFSQSYLNLWTHSDMWSSIMPEIKIAKEELFVVQLKNLSRKLHEYLDYLRERSLKQHNWTLWDKSEIEERAEDISNLFDQIGIGYIDDYLGLIHNRLASPILGHKKKPRENFANLEKLNKYYILTEKGLQEIINKKII